MAKRLYPSSLSDEERDIYDLFSARYPPGNAAGCGALASYVRDTFGIQDYWIAERIVWWVLHAALRGDEVTAHRPLLAARHLLGFYDYPIDPDEPFGYLGQSLNDRLGGGIGAGEVRNFRLSRRQIIAAGEGGYGVRTQLSGAKERHLEVISAVWVAVKVGLAKADTRRLKELCRNAISRGVPDWFLAKGAPDGWANYSKIGDDDPSSSVPEDEEPAMPKQPQGAEPKADDTTAHALVVPHLMSTFDDPMGVPRMLAPNGSTYQRWLASRSRNERVRFDFWMDLPPKEVEMFILHAAVRGPISNYSLHRDPFIRLVVERFGGEKHWNSAYGPLPALEAIQVHIEDEFEREKRNVSSATSLAQAVFLGRLILDPGQYEDSESKIRRHRPKSEHFRQVWAGWSDADILRNYRRWIVDMSMRIRPDEIDWSSRLSGMRGRVTPYKASNLVGGLFELASVGLSRVGLNWEKLPTLQAIMYEYGYDITSRQDYRDFIVRMSKVCPQHTRWWNVFFAIGDDGESSRIDADFWPLTLFTLIFARKSERFKASVAWKFFLLDLGVISSVRQLSNPASRVSNVDGFEYGTPFM